MRVNLFLLLILVTALCVFIGLCVGVPYLAVHYMPDTINPMHFIVGCVVVWAAWFLYLIFREKRDESCNP